ncbi:hypothetical protein KA005_70095, partial [bacterium]|nr:hypothetical protein [bacterium]
MFKKMVVPVVILVILIVAGILWRQTGLKKEEGPKTTGLPMKVAHDYWPGNYWIDIAATKGWFKETGLKVELVDMPGDFIGGIQEMVEGKIDVAQPVLFDLMK